VHRLAQTVLQERLAQQVDYKMLLVLEHALLVNTRLLHHHLVLIVQLA